MTSMEKSVVILAKVSSPAIRLKPSAAQAWSASRKCKSSCASSANEASSITSPPTSQPLPVQFTRQQHAISDGRCTTTKTRTRSPFFAVILSEDLLFALESQTEGAPSFAKRRVGDHQH